jgi:hypothetical protein
MIKRQLKAVERREGLIGHHMTKVASDCIMASISLRLARRLNRFTRDGGGLDLPEQRRKYAIEAPDF